VYVDRVLGELGYQKDSRGSRQKYGKYMEELAKKCREVDGKILLRLLPGWYIEDGIYRRFFSDCPNLQKNSGKRPKIRVRNHA
jgi:hypothetical protein